MNTNKKKPRRNPQRFNPLSYGDDYEEVKFNNLEEDILEDSASIIENLQSFDPKTREMATISLAQIDHFTEEFVLYLKDNGVLKLLIQRLVDPNPIIVLNSLMALSNIAACGMEIKQKSIGDLIIDSGILILLETMLSNFKQSHEQRTLDVKSPDFGIKIAVVDHGYKLLSNLAEVVCEESLDLLLNSQVTTISFYFIMSCDDSRILTGIGSYMQVLTESSVKLCQQIATNLDFVRRLVVISESGFSTQELKAYLLGSLYNYICTLERNNIEPEGKDELCQKVIQGMVGILGVKIFEEISNLTRLYEDNKRKFLERESKKKKNNKGNAMDVDPINHEEEPLNHVEETKENGTAMEPEDLIYDVRMKQALGIWSDSATAIQICLGIMINMFESEEGLDDEWKDDDDNEEEDETTNPKLNKYEPPRTSFMTNMTQEAREKILESVIDKCQHLDEKIYNEFLSDLKTVSDQTKSMVEFAFPCVMNILLNIEYSDKNTNSQTLNAVAEQIFKICLNEWKYYLEVLYSHSQEDPEESNDREDVSFEQNIVNEILKIMIELLQASAFDINLLDVSELLQVQAKTFNSLSQESKVATIELIGTRCHPKFGLKMEENALVADFFLELLKSDNVMIIGEALNALFDVYSEESYDEIFVQKGFMNVLTYGYDVFKKRIAENKNKLSKENHALLRNHLLNLRRFIKYKQQHVGK